jgi:hypothetical protein
MLDIALSWHIFRRKGTAMDCATFVKPVSASASYGSIQTEPPAAARVSWRRLVLLGALLASMSVPFSVFFIPDEGARSRGPTGRVKAAPGTSDAMLESLFRGPAPAPIRPRPEAAYPEIRKLVPKPARDATELPTIVGRATRTISPASRCA